MPRPLLALALHSPTACPALPFSQTEVVLVRPEVKPEELHAKP